MSGDWIIRMIEQARYLGVFFLMLLETMFPPIPSEVIMPVAGVAAARGAMSLWGVIASGTAGAMVGNFFWYLLARVIGLQRFRPLLERHGRWFTLDWYDVVKAEKLFGRFGSVIVCVGRMLPTIRSIVSIPAGLLRMRLKTFLLWSTVGTAIWSAGLTLAGFGLGRQFSRVEDFLGPLSMAVIVLIVVAYIWRQLTWRKRHPADEHSGTHP
jgi:membrane protein DedA with SNARE-associated domain